MSSLPGRRVGLAIVRIEIEDAVEDHVVINVKTIDEIDPPATPHERSFASGELALGHLRGWLADWPAG